MSYNVKCKKQRSYMYPTAGTKSLPVLKRTIIVVATVFVSAMHLLLFDISLSIFSKYSFFSPFTKCLRIPLGVVLVVIDTCLIVTSGVERGWGWLRETVNWSHAIGYGCEPPYVLPRRQTGKDKGMISFVWDFQSSFGLNWLNYRICLSIRSAHFNSLQNANLYIDYYNYHLCVFLGQKFNP